MTGLGAFIYCSFFGLAALWLFATSDYGRARLWTGRSSRIDAPELANTLVDRDDDETAPVLVGHSAAR